MSIEGRPIVFLASIDWSAPWQRHQAWAAAFTKAGHPVFFVENTGLRGAGPADAGRIVRRVRNLAKTPEASEAGVRVIPPAVLPPTSKPFRLFNRTVAVPRLIAKLRARGAAEGSRGLRLSAHRHDLGPP